ncbi:hypothetical protein TNCV_4648371 [Trichonephila clavipes]|uniref:Uncharacterized protein n=1 Tax=Trichonephila clavipes TaxID=2585209 RepID=A0A8X6SYF4_TRICX|nr:hypothetical protein TNCV_4648371 [Trichonephila clavipes]
MPVFSVARDTEPLRSSTAFRITAMDPLIPNSANSHWISTDASSKTAVRQTTIPVYATIRPLSKSEKYWTAPSSFRLNFTFVAFRLLGVAILISSSVLTQFRRGERLLKQV